MNEGRNFRFLSSFWLKIVAIVFMTVDHLGVFLLMYSQNPDYASLGNLASLFRIIGRIALPLFLFMLAEGMRYTHSKWRYLLRLGYVCLPIFIAQMIDRFGLNNYFGFGNFSNVFLDLVLYALILALLKEKGLKKLYALLPFAYIVMCYAVSVYEGYHDVTAIWLPNALRPGYSLYGLLAVLGFFYAPNIVYGIARKTLDEMGISREAFESSSQGRGVINALGGAFFFLINLGFWGLSFVAATKTRTPWDSLLMSVQAWSVLAIPFLLLYNGKRGYDSKPFRIATYLYFVVHLVIIYLIFRVSFGY